MAFRAISSTWKATYMPSTLKAILFDNDGVLVDTEQMFFESTRQVFAAAGTLLSPQQWAKLYLAEGRPSKEIALLLGMPATRADEIIPQRNADFLSRISHGVPPMAGVQELLAHLVKKVRLAVVTGASRQHFDRVHASTGLSHYFEQVITSDDYESVKPSPDAYLTALERLSLSPGECLAVEDSPRGANSAKAAGIPCALIPTGLTDISLCPPDCIVLQNLTQLLEWVTGNL
jgi:HAD superfamily hydrolase (TIGR01509 family)